LASKINWQKKETEKMKMRGWSPTEGYFGSIVAADKNKLDCG